uniref:Putative secreted protein n=1 Tax=Ixodes ricinus TaxID=34613 RepID=A0A6B0U617_IXORI
MNLWSLTSKTFFFFRAPLRALSLKPSIGCSRPSSFSSAMSAGVAAVVAFFFLSKLLQAAVTAHGARWFRRRLRWTSDT